MPQDGETVMYLYNVEFGGYFLGSNEWSTRASLSVTKGYKLKLVFQFDEGAWAIIDSVETQGAWKATFCDNPQSIWVDNNAGANWDQWVFSALGENTYEITNSAVGTSKLGATEYYDGTAGDDRLYLLDYTIMGENNQPIMSGNAYTTWAFVSESDYRDWRSELATYNAALTLGNYISASEANFPGIDLSAPKAVYNNTSSTLDELNAALANAKDIVYQYQFGGISLGEGVDYTDRITNPDFAGGSTAGWSDGFTVSSAYENAECYMKNFHIYQSLTGLPAGTYRVSVQGFYRQGTAAEDYEVNVLQTSPWFNAKIFATNSSNTEVTAPIMCLSDGRVKENLGNGSTTMPDGYYAPNTMESAKTWFDAGYYKPNSQYNSVMAEVLDDGLLTIGVQKSITINADWAIFDNFTLTYYGDAGGATTDSALARYNVAVENAKAVIADEANAAAVDEIAALQQLIDAEIPSTASEIEAAREAIEAATSAVISASAVKNYEKILAAYPQDVSGNVAGLALWAGDMVPNSGQHWDGTSTSVYYEQTGDQWLQSSWTNSLTTDVVFPAGKYVICMAGRSSSGSDIEAYLQVNDKKVIFPSKGDVGYGVDVNGVATTSPSATYANSGNGRGWEYRYVEFSSDGETPTHFTIGGTATAPHQWMSFTNPQFRSSGELPTDTAQTVVAFFDFENNNMDLAIGQAGDDESLHAGDMTGKAVTKAGVTFSVVDPEGASTPSRYFWVGSKGNTLNLFKNATINLTAAEGRAITGVTIVFQTTANSLEASSGTYTEGIWTGNADVLVFTAPATRYIYSIEVTTVEADAPDGLVNANFMVDTPETVGIRTYQKDVTGSGDKSQCQPVTGWTIKEYGDTHAAGTFQYGSSAFLGGEGYLPPTTGPDGQAGQALGLLAVWAGTTQYTQAVALPAGSHTLSIDIYNAGGTGTITKNLFGFDLDGAYATTTNYPVGQWTTETFSITLPESRDVIISLGYQAGNAGSSSMPHLFIDRVTIDTQETPDTVVTPTNTIVLNAPTFNVESGTSSYPNFLPAGSTVKVNFKAENLQENGLSEDDVRVKVKAYVYGDEVNAPQTASSPTAHSVSGATFYLPLGESDYPVALRPEYTYETISFTDVQLVKPAEEGVEEEVLVTYTGGTFMGINWVGFSSLYFTVDGIEYKQVSGNLFVNGSFDSGVYGWKTIGYMTDAVLSNFTYNTTGGFDGGPYLTTNGAGVGSVNTIRQAVAVEPGKQYYFTAYTNGNAPASENYAYNALFQMADSTTENGVLKAFEWQAENTGGQWTQTEYVFTAADGNPYVGVRMGWNQGSSFDGFALYEVSRQTSDLDVVRMRAKAEVESLPVGNNLFQYPDSAINAALAGINNAGSITLINALLANVRSAQILPKAGTGYLIKNLNSGMYLEIRTERVAISIEKEPLFFTAVDDSTYILSNEQGRYIMKAGTDSWTLSATTNMGEAYQLRFNVLPDGYTIQGANGLFGTDKLTDGSSVYANKALTADNALWQIEEYVAPVIPYEEIVNSGIQTVDLGSMGIDWHNLSDSAFVNAANQIDWANVEALRIPKRCSERILPYITRQNAPKLLDVVVCETTLPIEEMQKAEFNPNVMVRMPARTVVINAYGDTLLTVPTNVFIGGVADKVVLTDRSPYVTGFGSTEGEYYVKSIEYTRNFNKSTRIGKSSGWETLVLPFNVAEMTTADGRTLAPFGSSLPADAYFWLAELTADGFQLANAIQANRPYLIAMPNSEEYQPEYNITGDVTFRATDQMLHLSQDATSSEGSSMMLTPTYKDIALTDAAQLFAINDTVYQGYMPGGVFVRGQRAVRPFEATITQTSGAKQRTFIPIDFPAATGIDLPTLAGGQSTPTVIYDLTGRPVTAPTRGLYLVKGRKVWFK